MMEDRPCIRGPMLCPICKKPVDGTERDKPGSAYPFCSQRCKLIDLGRWLGGRYQIPAHAGDEDDEQTPPEDKRKD